MKCSQFSACIGAFSQGSVVVWSSTALQHIPENILGHSKEWVGSIFMIGAGLVPWFASIESNLVLIKSQ